MGITKTIYFTVGDKERHEAMLKIGGIFIPRLELYVDGKLVAKA